MNETNGKERREVLRLETNVPVVASLQYEEPLGPYPGRYGDQFMYTLTTEAGEKVIYLDPPVSNIIQQLGLRRGEPFKIGKFTRTDGNRRGVEWKVRRLEPEEMAPATPSPFDDPPPTPPAPFDDPPPVESGGAAPPPPVSKSGTALSGAPERQPNVPQPTTNPPQTKIEDALCTVVSACYRAGEHARLIGFQMPPFTSEDISKMAMTLAINNRNGAVR